MTRDYWRTIIRPGEPVHPCDMCMAELGEPTVVECPCDAICVRCGLIHELPGPAAAGQLTGENRARSAGYLHREPTQKWAAGSIPASPVSFPFLPAVPKKPDAAQLPGGRGLSSSRSTPAGAFYSQNPARDREQTGGLSGAVKAAKPTAMAERSSPELCRRSPYTLPRANRQHARTPRPAVHILSRPGAALTQET